MGDRGLRYILPNATGAKGADAIPEGRRYTGAAWAASTNGRMFSAHAVSGGEAVVRPSNTCAQLHNFVAFILFSTLPRANAQASDGRHAEFDGPTIPWPNGWKPLADKDAFHNNGVPNLQSRGRNSGHNRFGSVSVCRVVYVWKELQHTVSGVQYWMYNVHTTLPFFGRAW